MGWQKYGLLSAVFMVQVGCSSAFDIDPEIANGGFPAASTIPALHQFETATFTMTATITSMPTHESTNTPKSSGVLEVEETLRPMEGTEPSATIQSVTPTITNSPTLSPTPEPAPTATAEIILVNGIPRQDFILFPNNARQHVKEIFLLGQSIGRNPKAFSKLGDSVTLTDHFLTRFDSGHYVLGPYEFLQPTIGHFAGSFQRYGVATKVGLHAWSIFDPLWANKEWCLADEDMVACEIRLFNPAVMMIKIGSNDNGAADAFDSNIRELVDFLIEQGVIPIIATKADRFEGPDDRNNKMLRQIAFDYSLPLLDYDLVAGTLPRRGLSGDDVHMTMADSNDYNDPKTFERGYPVSDLTILMMLHEILQEVKEFSAS